jgi:HK97 family phage prohead protease
MTLPFMNLEEYKAKLKKGEDVSEALLRKQFTIEPITKAEEDKDGLKINFTISTETVDRDQDSIAVDGWQLDDYRKNPVILWAHDSRQPPVARSLSEWTEDKKLKSTAQFTPKDLNPYGYMIGQMYEKGYMKAVSVGFKSVEAKWSVDQSRPWGIDYFKQLLLEYSCVPVPANPEALMDAKAAGIDLDPMLDWAIRVLDEGIIVPKSKAEQIYKILNTKSTFTIPEPIEKQDNLISIYEKQIQINRNWR